VRGLQSSRSTVMSFAAKNPAYTIIHKNLSRMEDVTSSHTYQKGSWTLHMLRGVIGSEAFQRGIRAYYARHFNGNATTADFRRAMEEASGQELGWFFEQWLYKPGTLKVAGSWSYDAAARQVRLTLDQVQTDGSLFTMPLEIGVYSKGQPTPVIERVRMTARSNVFTINTATAPDSVRLDPNVWVLMDATFEKRP
jgi:aminopeptidase N